MLVPLLNEAAWVVYNGNATVAEVDSTATASLGLPMGCFELSDQIGIDVAVDVLNYMHETLGSGYAPCPLLVEKTEAGEHGKKTVQGFYDWEGDGADIPPDETSAEVRDRLVGVAINEVSKLVDGDVAGPSEIDRTVQLGAGFPDGPTEIATSIGYDRLRETLCRLSDETDGGRYEPTSLLEGWAATGGPGQ